MDWIMEWFGGKTFDPEKDIPSLAGKVVIVTGGNVGLGKETVLQLAKHNPKEIFLAARTKVKADAAIDDIKKAVPDSSVSFLHLDLTSFKSIHAAAEDFKSRSDRLDLLINNAGVMALPYSKTEDGYEIQFGTNHMGHALLTKLLLPTLLKTAEKPDSDVRVINVSSQGHLASTFSGINFDQDGLQNTETWLRYAQSKLANILHARELQKRYPSITATAVHPGVIATDLYSSAGQSQIHSRIFAGSVAMGNWLGMLYNVPRGAKNQLWAATAPKDEVRSWHYWVPVGVKGYGSWHAGDAASGVKLWEWSEAEFKGRGYD